MANNKGLGRGFASLMGMNDIDDLTQPQQPQQNATAADATANATNADNVVRIALIDIDPNREQPRKNFDEEALNELAESIRVHGVIQPIVVTPIG